MKKFIKDILLNFMFNILKDYMYNDLPFSPKRTKIEKVGKLVANLHNKTEYVIHIRNFKQALNHGLVFKKVHGVNKFTQNAQVKQYFVINTDLKKIAKK